MFITLALAGGAIPPIAPTISYGSLFDSGTKINATITNYNPEYTYSVILTPGSFTRSASTINITGLTAGQSFNLLVIATTAKGLSAPSSAVTDRQPYTYRTETRTGTRFVDTTSCYNPSPGPTCPFGGTLNIAGTQCCIPSGYTESYTFTVSVKNDTPAGYLDSGYDWYSVGNISVERTPYTFYTETYSYTYPCSGTCCAQTTCRSTCPDTCSEYGLFCCAEQCVPRCLPSGFTPPGCCSCYAGNWSGTGSCCCAREVVCNNCFRYYPCTKPCDVPCTVCSPCTVTCTGTATRQVRNATPAGYLDSGVDWYRFV